MSDSQFKGMRSWSKVVELRAMMDEELSVYNNSEHLSKRLVGVC
jgi:hypothetical protein